MKSTGFRCSGFAPAACLLCVLSMIALIMPAGARGAQPRPPASKVRFAVEGTRLVDRESGARVFLKGIGYSPFMPGESPIAMRLPDDGRYAGHLAMIRHMNANFIHVFPEFMPAGFFAALRQSGLFFGQDIFVAPLVDDLMDEGFQQRSLSHVKRVIDHVIASGAADRLVFFSVGDELNPGAIFRTDKAHPQVTEFKGKYIRITGRTPSEVALARLVDSAMAYEQETYGVRHLFTHTSYTHLGPVADRPDLEVAPQSVFFPDFGDIICLNVYPYARGVVTSPPGSVTGTNYQGYIEDLARISKKPVIVTQVGLSTSPLAPRPDIRGFGGNSVAQAAAVYRRVWQDITTAAGSDIISGVAFFEFCDEWWKPGSAGDEFQHEEDDPEEWFGIYGVDRQHGLLPKGNLAEVVRSIFAP